VLADDQGRGLPHVLNVEGPVECVNVMCDPRRADFTAKDSIFVALGQDAVPSVEVRTGVLGAQDADRGRQSAIECAVEVSGGNGRSQLEGRHLRASMNSGVCASAALGKDTFSGEALDGRGELALNSDVIRLDLPTVKICAVVGECELPVHAAFLFHVSGRILSNCNSWGCRASR